MKKKSINPWIIFIGIILVGAVVYLFLSNLNLNFIKNNPIQKQICIPNEKKCIGNELQVCNYDGLSWGVYQECNGSCTNDYCQNDNKICDPNGMFCSGDLVETCSPDGTNYVPQKYCAIGQTCRNNDCYFADQCSLGSKRCKGNIIQDCVNNGISTIWVDGDVCSYQCLSGTCMDSPFILNPQKSNLGYYIVFSSYESARKLAGISDDYLKETTDYDYSNIYLGTWSSPGNQNFIKNFKTTSPKDWVKSVVQYVYSNVDYDTKYQTSSYCYNTPASKVLVNGKGVCNTMARATVAMLRGSGIAARAVTGCVRTTLSCSPLLVEELQKSDRKLPIINDGILDNGRYITGGGDHTWVEAWLPNYGWIIVESTAGVIFTDSCVDYNKYADDSNFGASVDKCSLNLAYHNMCQSF